jgi:hypothetical protein
VALFPPFRFRAARRARSRVALFAGALTWLAGAAGARAQTTASGAACFPACRAGYLCHEGQCVSACNPPCGVGETCTAAGECRAAVLIAPAPPESETPSALPPPNAVQTTADPGWARGASYLGFVSAGVDVALTAAVIATNPHQPGRSRTIGSWAIAVFGMTVPVTALGGASARTHPAVVGRPRLRIASWVTYAAALADSAYLLSRSRIAVIDNRYVVGAGLLGTLSTIGFALDAHASASQAEAVRASAPSQPSLGLAMTANGALVPTWGWAGAF